MLPGQVPDGQLRRARPGLRALWLVSASVAFGLVSGVVSVVSGLRGHSLGVFAVGLGVLADVTGSAPRYRTPGTPRSRRCSPRPRPGSAQPHDPV
jgi:hypothetical protein